MGIVLFAGYVWESKTFRQYKLYLVDGSLEIIHKPQLWPSRILDILQVRPGLLLHS